MPFNIATYFFSIINPSSLLPPSKSFFLLIVSFHYSPAYTGCCSTLHQDAWPLAPVVLQGSSQPCPHYSAATDVGPLCWIQHSCFGFLLLFILLWQSRGLLERNTAPTATSPYVIISFPISWSSFLPLYLWCPRSLPNKQPVQNYFLPFGHSSAISIPEVGPSYTIT